MFATGYLSKAGSGPLMRVHPINEARPKTGNSRGSKPGLPVANEQYGARLTHFRQRGPIQRSRAIHIAT
jgi:hypothetical protein